MLGLLEVQLQMTKPYKDIEITDSYIIREFDENIDPIELLWHRDDESRIVEIIGKTNWKLQLDNQLPTSLNSRIFIDMIKLKELLNEIEEACWDTHKQIGMKEKGGRMVPNCVKKEVFHFSKI